LTRPVPTPPHIITEVRKLYGAGVQHRVIAERLGITLHRVRKALEASDIRRPTPGNFEGQNLSDPNRADKLLRRFSWEAS
jgi:hypothetical protein